MFFYLQLVISFLIGGLLIALQTLIAERVSPLWRGAILALPSTMALGLFFIGLAKSPQDVVEATHVVPLALGIDYLFVAVFSLTISRGLLTSMLISLITWGTTAALLLSYPPAYFINSTVLGVLLTFFSYSIIRVPDGAQNLKKFPINTKHIIARSLIGGTVIALALFLSKTLDNVWGGVFAAFPAAFSSTFIIYYYLQGKESIRAVGKSLFFPGAVGLMIYAGVISVTYVHLGIVYGTLAAYATVFPFVYLWLRLKTRYSNRL